MWIVKITQIEIELLKIKQILNDIEKIQHININIKLDLKSIQKMVRRKRNNIELDSKVNNAILLLRCSDKKTSYRNIAKLLNMQNSLRSIQLSIQRQWITL